MKALMLGIVFILMSCNHEKQKQASNPSKIKAILEKNQVRASFFNIKAKEISDSINQNKTAEEYSTELVKVLKDTSTNGYFKEIYLKEKLIWADDNMMLSITDSLFTCNKDTEIFFFIVFTKSMKGSDGFYAEALGTQSLRYVTQKTEHFAEYFSKISKLNREDFESWVYFIFNEIEISNENEELTALEKLKQNLLKNSLHSNVKGKSVINTLIKELESKASKKGFMLDK